MGLTTTREARWDDVGAPVLNNNPGSFIGCIKPFLLTCGWSVIWEDGFKLVMRNSIAHGGSGCYVRFEENSATFVTIGVFEEMTDIDTGINSAGSMEVWKSENNSTPKPYVFLGDERTC